MRKLLIISLLLTSFEAHCVMDKDRCGSAIVTALKALNPDIQGAAETNLLPYWVAVCDQLILEIRNNMDITTIVTVPGVTPGPTTVGGTGVDATIL